MNTNTRRAGPTKKAPGPAPTRRDAARGARCRVAARLRWLQHRRPRRALHPIPGGGRRARDPQGAGTPTQSWAAPFFARLMTREMVDGRRARMALLPTQRTGAAWRGFGVRRLAAAFGAGACHGMPSSLLPAAPSGFALPDASRPAAPFVVGKLISGKVDRNYNFEFSILNFE